MSFSREEILGEFSDATELGGYWTHEAQIERWESRRLRCVRAERAHRARRVLLPPMPVRPVYRVTPLPIESVRCPRCGAPCERRAGMKQLIHRGRHCSK